MSNYIQARQTVEHFVCSDKRVINIQITHIMIYVATLSVRNLCMVNLSILVSFVFTPLYIFPRLVCLFAIYLGIPK